MNKGAEVNIACNSGAIYCEIFGYYRSRQLKVGDIVKVAIKKSMPNLTHKHAAQVKKGSVVLALIVRSKQAVKTNDGGFVKADDNAVVLLKNDFTPYGTNVTGRAFRAAFNHHNENIRRIMSICEEVD